MGSPLTLRPDYGSKSGQSQLPQGPPAGKGLSLDKDIPGTSTYAKPEGDIRNQRKDDESIFRVDNADDLLKDQSNPDVNESNADKHDGIGYWGRAPNDSTTKTKYPYGDNRPNKHASLHRIVKFYRR